MVSQGLKLLIGAGGIYTSFLTYGKLQYEDPQAIGNLENTIFRGAMVKEKAK